MLDPITIIEAVGLTGIFLIVFAESGLFFGFFLPGDTLLFSAGLFASQGFFPIEILIVGCIIAAIAGDSVGYWIGKKMGRRLFEREASFFFNKKRIADAERFYAKYGAATIILARFIPVIRTFAPIVAGAARMKYRTFILNNVIGGIIWAVGVPLLGYYFGSLIPNPDRFILPVIIFVLCVSFLPFFIKIAFHVIKRRR
ncbi:MAG: DedA family protein [Patescibacteria group bacterium]